MTTPTDSPTGARPGKINARPVAHPGRWFAVAAMLILVLMMINSFITNASWDWPEVLRVMQFSPVLEGLLYGTIIATLSSMVIGILLGVLLAVMRLSDNPVLRAIAFAYTWFFRAVPRYVLLVVLGTGILTLYRTLDFGVPFSKEFGHLIGLPEGLVFYTLDVRDISSGIMIGIIGLALSEAAYMAEIARAGILSVDDGQREAAEAIGMSKSQAMRRIILPQAMRVIVPPTGNETIAMVKDTSLLNAVPITMELFFQAKTIGQTTYNLMPAYVGAVIWYLIICSILMVGQSYLERRYGKGVGAAVSPSGGKGLKEKLLSVAGIPGGGQ